MKVMHERIATGLATTEAGAAAYAEAAEAAARRLEGAPVDLVAVFAGAAHLADVDEGLAAVRDRLRPRAVIGCGAQGVVGEGRELESGGVAVWAASLPGAELESFQLEVTPAGESAVAVSGMPDLDEAQAVIILVDPYTFPIEPLLAQMAEDHPGLPVIGGLASAGGGAGLAALLSDDGVVRHGAVGVAMAGVHVRPCVSQGARPVGPEMVVTAAEGNVIHGLASQPALARLREAIGELDVRDRALAARGLLLGIVVDENKPDYERGDFLVRGLLGVDEDEQTVSVGERVRVGQTVRLHVRDGESADEDLREALARERAALERPPAGALLFTCNGRGSHMFGHADHDASAVAGAFADAPAAGFFCAGEIGPVGDRSFVHGFTATLALFGR